MVYFSLVLGSGGFTKNLLTAAFSDANSVEKAIFYLRLSRTLTAVAAGGMLSICGLLMQNLFRNPLAGPSVLGVSSGSALAVAIIFLLGLQVSYTILVLFSVLGALAVLLLMLLLFRRLKSVSSVLIAGIITGYLLSAILSLLASVADAERIKRFVFWGFGGFNHSKIEVSVALVGVALLVFALIFKLAPKMNAYNAGTLQAFTFGLNVKKFTSFSIVISGLVVGVITAFCGPIAFVGIVVPHLARIILKTANYKALVPLTFLLGAVLALLADVIARAPWSIAELPLNAILSIFGAPVIFYLIFNGTKKGIWN